MGKRRSCRLTLEFEAEDVTDVILRLVSTALTLRRMKVNLQLPFTLSSEDWDLEVYDADAPPPMQEVPAHGSIPRDEVRRIVAEVMAAEERSESDGVEKDD